MTGTLTGKAALVTGGLSGFGRATVERFLADGARVAVVDIACDTGEGTVPPLGDGSVPYVRADVRDEAEVDAAFAQVAERLGGLDIVVNNAGVIGGSWIHEDGATAELDRQWSVNVRGVWNGCRAALVHLRERGGVIINTASSAALAPTPAAPAYGLCKAAVVHLTQSLALAYAADGVRVNAVLPGPAMTGIFGGDDEQRAALERSYVERVPLGRIGTVEDIAGAMAYLASAAFVTGTALNVDGGFRPGLPAAS